MLTNILISGKIQIIYYPDIFGYQNIRLIIRQCGCPFFLCTFSCIFFQNFYTSFKNLLTFDAQSRASECPDVKNYKLRLNPVWHRMLYSCTRMATVGVKALRRCVTCQIVKFDSRTRRTV